MIQLLFGKERFLKEEAITQLKARFFRSPSEQDLNFESFDAQEQGIAAVLSFLSTAPFLADKRLAVLWGVDALEPEDALRLASAVKSLPGTACLVLETQETNTRKNASVRALSECASAMACHTPFERELPAWVEGCARKKGLSLERGTALFLSERVGPDLAALHGTLETLKLFVHPRRNVTITDVQTLAPSNPEEDVFRLADLLLEDRKKDALKLVDGLYRSGARAPEVVAALAGQLERYKKCLAAVAVGRPLSQIGEEMRIPRPFQQAFFTRLRKTSEGRLRDLQKALLVCDESFKSGQSEERLALEKFVLTT